MNTAIRRRFPWRRVMLGALLTAYFVTLWTTNNKPQLSAAELGTQRSHIERKSAVARMVTLARDGSTCEQHIDTHQMSVLRRNALPTQSDFLKGLKSSCWLQELTPEDIEEMRSGFVASEFLSERSDVYAPYATVPASYARLRCLPFFYLIGAAKSATSDLWNRIRFHPQLARNFVKENQWWTIRRFHRNEGMDISRPDERATFDEYVNLGEIAMQNLINIKRCAHDSQPWVPNSKIIFGDGSTSYQYDGHRHRIALMRLDTDSFQPPLEATVPRSVAALQPRARILAILREPGERLFSEYLYLNAAEDEEKSSRAFHNSMEQFIDSWDQCIARHNTTVCVEREECLTKGSMYILQLEKWLDAFPREQVLILRTEDYAREPRSTLLTVFHHLGMDEPTSQIMAKMLDDSRKNRRRNTVAEIKMLPETRTMLSKHYRHFNEQLAAMLGSNKFLWDDVLSTS